MSSEKRPGGAEGWILSRSEKETEQLAADLGSVLKGGECVLLTGELGAGKTTFIRGLARGLGAADPDAVHSPSYTLVLRYPGRVGLTHIDAYFMNSEEDLDLCGFDDALNAGDVAAVEWAEKIAPAIKVRGLETIAVRLRHAEEGKRDIFIARQSGHPFLPDR